MDAKKVDAIIERHKSERGALISMLHAIQDEEGSLSVDTMSYLSDKLATPLGEISRVATYFDKAFKLAPKEEHTVRVCRGTTCHVKKSDDLYKDIYDELSKDGKGFRFSLGQARCLGCCTSSGPVAEIDGEVYEQDSAKSTIIKLKGEMK
jgi:NADP-reducing hydrogenase subunit HndA